MVPELYPNMYEKRQKTGFRKNAIIQTTMKAFDSKFDAEIFKQVSTICSNYEYSSSELTKKHRVKEHYCGAGPVHHGNRLYGKKENFLVL